MILELHERDAKVLEQILSILKNHPEIEKFEIDEEPMVSLPGLEIFPSKRKVFRDRQEIQLTAKEYRIDRKSTRLNSSHLKLSRMPSSA